jgi:hypothetical protein
MIYLITGKPGTGKTLTSVKLGYQFIRQGRDVYYNFEVDYSPLDIKQTWLSKLWHRLLVALDFEKPRENWGKVYRWGRSRQAGLKEFPSINKGVIFMDEGHIWVNSREYTELSPEFHYKVAQHRKDGLDIYIISQHEARIDISGGMFTTSANWTKRTKNHTALKSSCRPANSITATTLFLNLKIPANWNLR